MSISDAVTILETAAGRSDAGVFQARAVAAVKARLVAQDELLAAREVAPLHNGDVCAWDRDCDEPATAQRFSPHIPGWLPVCDEHWAGVAA